MAGRAKHRGIPLREAAGAVAGEIVGTKIGLCLKHHVPREPAVGGPHHERRPEQFPGYAIRRLVEKSLG